jgi:hypothetical protein
MQRAVERQNVNVIASAVVAGITGGVLIDAFLAVVNHMSPIAIWQFVASALVGGVAYTSTSYAVLGFIMHFAISIALALIYAAAAGALPALVRKPVLGGLLYGVVVMFGMTMLLALKHVGPAGVPDALTLTKSLIAHTVFFGLPVALVISKGIRA